ncbi:MAG: hypothetical protein M1812_006890 [Candelaria pacifica]|nr:MAG: hypothetical protein M1812_006890 [Candelaria pacifica]
MDIFLGKVTQQAMNYAIRLVSIRSIRVFIPFSHIPDLELPLPADMPLENAHGYSRPSKKASSARGNTSLETAVSLTKALRWDIQSLGTRLATAANAEELTRRGGSKAKSRAQNELEFKAIIRDIRKLLERIEDAVPLINLAITTSGASLSTNLPATISPSRLLQASTFLTAGDTQFSMVPSQTVQIGPPFTLSLYMLFSGHSHRLEDEEGVREATWKEVIHKARVKLLRTPLEAVYDDPIQGQEHEPEQTLGNGGASTMDDGSFARHIAGEVKADEFAYQLLIIEDLDDDRVHTFEDDEPQPGHYEEVELAGIREAIPIHEISKIFYADTGKILNIGNEGEVNSPVLLLKRDVNAVPPRRMMEKVGRDGSYEEENISPIEGSVNESNGVEEGQSELDAQLFREERSTSVHASEAQLEPSSRPYHWRLPPNLDPEWLAFEVYTETEDSESDTEDQSSELETLSLRPAQSSRQGSIDSALATGISTIHLQNGALSPVSAQGTPDKLIPTPRHSSPFPFVATNAISAGPVRTSLSLLETLIRLTALQQFQQASHLAINDELLNFFLEESSTTGAGGNGDERRRKREAARRRVGFDPYDESPIKRRGEAYQGQQYNQQQSESEYGGSGYDGGESYASPRFGAQGDWYPRSREMTPESQSPLLLRNGSSSPRAGTPDRGTSTRTGSVGYTPPSQFSPAEAAKGRQALLRRETARAVKQGSPLGRSVPVEADSTLGTSPPSAGESNKES